VVGKPVTEHRQLSRAKRPLVMSAIERVIKFYRIRRLLRLLTGKAVLKIDQGFAPIHPYATATGADNRQLDTPRETDDRRQLRMAGELRLATHGAEPAAKPSF